MQEENMASVSKCSTCGEDVRSDDKALLCDICETWEHQLCVYEKERLSDELYQSVTACSSKSIMYVCTPCRNKGSLSMRLIIDNTRLIWIGNAPSYR